MGSGVYLVGSEAIAVGADAVHDCGGMYEKKYKEVIRKLRQLV